MHRHLHATLAAGLLATAGAAQFTPITSSQRAHIDARLCPDASCVAYRVGTQMLGVVFVASRNEVPLYTSPTNNLSSYVWGINNLDLFFAEGSAIRRVPNTGGAPVTLPGAGAIAGTDVRLWCIDPLGQVLFGTRRDAGTNTSYLFSVPAAGGTPTDLLNRPGVIDDVGIDETGGFLLLRHWSGPTPVPATFVRYDLAASTALTMTTVNQLAEGAHWVTPLATHFVVAMNSPSHATPQIARIDNAGGVVWLVDDTFPHRRPFAGHGSHLIAYETTSPTGGGVTVGLVPNHGGGVVLLDTGAPLYLNGGASTGGLTFNGLETIVALCAGTSASDPYPQIHVTDLDQELHVHPQLITGTVFQIELHLDLNEIGGVAVADGLAGTPFTLPSLLGGFWLDLTPGHMTTVLTGIGNGTGAVFGNYGIPANPNLVGLRLWFQGVRFDATLTGGFMRFGYFQVF